MTRGLTLIAVDAVTPRPWRNGGGVTRELHTWPSTPDWQWRISVADIAADGLFSAYPGIERWFAVVEGDGVVLHHGTQRVVVDVRSTPHRFDGAEPPSCSLQGGPTRDLNLMVRRSAGAGTMQRVNGDDEWLSAAPMRALFTTDALTLQIDDTDAASVPAWTLAVGTHAAGQRWRALAGSDAPRAWWLDFRPRPGP